MRIEIRKCIHCGEEKSIPQPEKFARNICKECRNKASNYYNTKKALANGSRPGTTGRRPYPLGNEWNSTHHKFRTLGKKMFKIMDKEEWRIEMRNRLNEVIENEELISWINAHDEDEPIKKASKIKRDYPDTRGMTWEEYERGLGDNEVDS